MRISQRQNTMLTSTTIERCCSEYEVDTLCLTKTSNNASVEVKPPVSEIERR